jgi:arginine deiminase
LNNLLHNEIIKIIEVALTESESSALNASLLKDNILLNFIREEVEEDKKIKAGASVYKSRKGFIAHLINLSMKLREVAETNSAVKRLIESKSRFIQPLNSLLFMSPLSKSKYSTPKRPLLVSQ